MSHGLMPSCASSTIRSLMALGRGLPLTNTPPSWFTSPKAGSASKRKHTRRTRRMAQKGASELLLIARQMSQLGDPQVTPRTLLYNSGMPPKLKGGRGRERQIGKGKKKKPKNKNEGGKKKKKRREGRKKENPRQQMSELSGLGIKHIPEKHIPGMKNEIAPTDKSALLPQEKKTTKKRKREEKHFRRRGGGGGRKSS